VELKWTEFALNNLKSYQSTSKKSSSNLIKYYASLINGINDLTLNAELGRAYSNIEEYTIRQLIFREHRILYLINNNTIVLLALVHTAYPINEALKYISEYLKEL
jgi:hypothetical protein